MGILHRSVVKVAVEFQDCQAAQSAKTPEAIRVLASAPIAEQLKRYRDQVDYPDEEELELSDAPSAEKVASLGSRGSRPYYYGTIDSPQRWVIVREQIVFIKQDVILAPSVQYAPQTPEAQAVTQKLTAQTTQVQTFEKSHPEIASAKTGTTFSELRPHSYEHRAESLRNGARANRRALASNRLVSGRHRRVSGEGEMRRVKGGHKKKQRSWRHEEGGRN